MQGSRRHRLIESIPGFLAFWLRACHYPAAPISWHPPVARHGDASGNTLWRLADQSDDSTGPGSFEEHAHSWHTAVGDPITTPGACGITTAQSPGGLYLWW